jgi:hypothetical protein
MGIQPKFPYHSQTLPAEHLHSMAMGKTLGFGVVAFRLMEMRLLQVEAARSLFMIYWLTREQSKFRHTLMMLTVAVGQILTLEMSS